MQLYLLETAISLLFIFHVKDLDQFESHHSFVLYSFGFENIRKLSLANKFLNLKSIDDHADMKHHIIAGVRCLIFALRRHLRLDSYNRKNG